MEGDVGGIFSEAPDWKSLFLLKIKIKQNSGCPNKEYNAILQYIQYNEYDQLRWNIMNIRAYLRSKKNLHW